MLVVRSAFLPQRGVEAEGAEVWSDLVFFDRIYRMTGFT